MDGIGKWTLQCEGPIIESLLLKRSWMFAQGQSGKSVADDECFDEGERYFGLENAST